MLQRQSELSTCAALAPTKDPDSADDDADGGYDARAAFSEAGPKGAFNAVLHFVCYVHCDGKIYELDGLKRGPVEVGTPPVSRTKSPGWRKGCIKR